MDSEREGRLSASMEENDDLPACRVTLGSHFYHPSFAGLVLSHVVTVIPHDGMDDPQELPGYGDERPHPLHNPAGEPRIIVIHDPIFSDHLDCCIEQDLPQKASAPLGYPSLTFSFPRADLVEVKPCQLHNLRLGAELGKVPHLPDDACHRDNAKAFDRQ
jgi:hypothetical protein